MTVQSQAVLNQLVAWLSEIRQANGYFSNAGDDVRTEQSHSAEPDADCIYLFDLDSEYSSSTAKRGLWTQRYLIEFPIRDRGDGRARARIMLADIHHALTRPLLAWSATLGVSDMKWISRSIPARAINSDWVVPMLEFEVTFINKAT